MPPRRIKVDHRRGGGSKHVSSFEEVKARNAGEETAYDRARRERQEKVASAASFSGKKAPKDESSAEDSSSGEEEPDKKAGKNANSLASLGFEIENPNAVKRNEDKEGVELTRKQREELDKAAARRRYEELHKAGKTDEAKADLARLEEVKKRREEAAKKRAEEEARAREKEGVKGPGIDRGAVIEQLKEMGSEAARMRGDRSKKKDDKEEKNKDTEGFETNDKDFDDTDAGQKKKIMNGVDVGDVYSSYASTVSVKGDKGEKAKAEKAMAKPKVTDGSIEACREAEADFM